MASSSSLKLSDFTIKKKLGEGSYSQVSLVIRNADQLSYALKQVSISRLNEKERENALNEVRFLASIRHKNIIGYRAAFLDEPSQTLCIVMEYANDGDLLGKVQDMRKRGTQLAEAEIWRIFIQLAQGLQCLHEMKIMHRDLKPANVFLWKGGQSAQVEGEQNEITVVAKIGDMNVSKLAQHNGLNYTQTGTPYYASPEVWRDQPYDFKSDVWSLGCILYEMTALRAPFQAQDMDNLFKKVIKGSYQKVPAIFSNDLHTMIRTMLTVDPAQRPSIYQVLSMPCVLARMEKMFPEDTPPNQSIQSQNSTKKPQVSSRLNKLKGNGTQSCGQLLSTIRDTKDLKLLKNQLPKSNFESEITQTSTKKEDKKIKNIPQIVTNESLDHPIDEHDITGLKTNKKLRKNSANRTKTSQQQQSDSSVSLLARNQSQKLLQLSNNQPGISIKNNKTSRQQLLPSLQPNKELLMVQQRIRESSQNLKKSKSKLNYGGRAVAQSRNDTNVNQSYNSITQDQQEVGIQRVELKQERESFNNSRVQLQQSTKQRIIGLERARSEQRLLNNVNTPSYNLLPLLGVVNEVIIPPLSNKKMNLKQSTTKRISKQQANAPSQLSNSKATNIKPLSPSHSPNKQYGTSQIANPSQLNSLNTSIIKNQVANKLNQTKQRDNSVLSQRLNYDITNKLLPHSKINDSNKQKRKNNHNQDLAELKLLTPFNQERLEESPRAKTRPQIMGQYLSSDNNSQENSPKVNQRSKAGQSHMRNSQERLINFEKLNSLSKNMSSLNYQINHQYYHVNHANQLPNTEVNQSLNYDLIPHSNDSKLASLIGITQPKIKPVKVIPSSRRRKEQQNLLGSLQSSQANEINTIREAQMSPLPYQPHTGVQNSQMNSLKPSSSNITLLPIQSVRGKTTQPSLINSQKTTVTAHPVNELHHYHAVGEDKLKIPQNSSILHLNPSLSKPMLMPLRQQLYMDERNPFLDDQALNKVRQDTKTNRNSSKNSLFNYSELVIDQYSTKNSQRNYQNLHNLAAPNIVYQIPVPTYQRPLYQSNEMQQSNSSVLLQANLQQKSSQFMHRRNNSSFDYSDPSQKFQSSYQPIIVDHPIQQQQRSQSKIANPDQVTLPPSSQQIILNQIMSQPTSNQRSTSRTNQLQEDEGMVKRKNRIGLLEKARKVLINQSSNDTRIEDTHDPHYFSRGFPQQQALLDNNHQSKASGMLLLKPHKSASQMMLINQN